MSINLNFLDNFLEMLTAERSASHNTIVSYKNDLLDFIKFLVANKVEITGCNLLVTKKYLSYLANKQLTAKSIRRKISSIKQFLYFLLSEKIIDDSFSLELDLPKKEQTLPKALPQSNINKLFEVAYRDESYNGLRLVAMLEIMYSTGLRVSELINLKTHCLQKNINKKISEQFMIIKGKGEKERLVVLNQQSAIALNKYLNIRLSFVKFKASTDLIFPSFNKCGKVTPISRQRFGQLLKQLAVDANIDPNEISPHKIRHSFASHMLENGANLRVVQELLGHADITSTQIYTKIITEQTKKLVFENHPLVKEDDN